LIQSETTSLVISTTPIISSGSTTTIISREKASATTSLSYSVFSIDTTVTSVGIFSLSMSKSLVFEDTPSTRSVAQSSLVSATISGTPTISSSVSSTAEFISQSSNSVVGSFTITFSETAFTTAPHSQTLTGDTTTKVSGTQVRYSSLSTAYGSQTTAADSNASVISGAQTSVHTGSSSIKSIPSSTGSSTSVTQFSASNSTPVYTSSDASLSTAVFGLSASTSQSFGLTSNTATLSSAIPSSSLISGSQAAYSSSFQSSEPVSKTDETSTGYRTFSGVQSNVLTSGISTNRAQITSGLQQTISVVESFINNPQHSNTNLLSTTYSSQSSLQTTSGTMGLGSVHSTSQSVIYTSHVSNAPGSQSTDDKSLTVAASGSSKTPTQNLNPLASGSNTHGSQYFGIQTSSGPPSGSTTYMEQTSNYIVLESSTILSSVGRTSSGAQISSHSEEDTNTFSSGQPPSSISSVTVYLSNESGFQTIPTTSSYLISKSASVIKGIQTSSGLTTVAQTSNLLSSGSNVPPATLTKPSTGTQISNSYASNTSKLSSTQISLASQTFSSQTTLVSGPLSLSNIPYTSEGQTSALQTISGMQSFGIQSSGSFSTVTTEVSNSNMIESTSRVKLHSSATASVTLVKISDTQTSRGFLSSTNVQSFVEQTLNPAASVTNVIQPSASQNSNPFASGTNLAQGSTRKPSGVLQTSPLKSSGFVSMTTVAEASVAQVSSETGSRFSTANTQSSVEQISRASVSSLSTIQHSSLYSSVGYTSETNINYVSSNIVSSTSTTHSSSQLSNGFIQGTTILQSTIVQTESSETGGSTSVAQPSGQLSNSVTLGYSQYTTVTQEPSGASSTVVQSNMAHSTGGSDLVPGLSSSLSSSSVSLTSGSLSSYSSSAGLSPSTFGTSKVQTTTQTTSASQTVQPGSTAVTSTFVYVSITGAPSPSSPFPTPTISPGNADYGVMGCFDSGASNISYNSLAQSWSNSTHLDVDTCLAYCAAGAPGHGPPYTTYAPYTYSILEYHGDTDTNWCYCTNEFPDYKGGPVDNNYCDSICPGNILEFCGGYHPDSTGSNSGPNFAEVYSLRPQSSSTTLTSYSAIITTVSTLATGSGGSHSGRKTVIPTAPSSNSPSPTPSPTANGFDFILGVVQGNTGNYKAKRQSATQYLGSSGVTWNCDDATIFTLFNGQLSINSYLISTNPFVASQVFGVVENDPTGSITETFVDSNHYLFWLSPEFTDGSAFFCEMANGFIQVLFDGEDNPAYPACRIVSLLIIPGTFSPMSSPFLVIISTTIF
jgi:hypothetical protein